MKGRHLVIGFGALASVTPISLRQCQLLLGKPGCVLLAATVRSPEALSLGLIEWGTPSNGLGLTKQAT